MPAATGTNAHTHIWGALLQATNGLTYGLVADEVDFNLNTSSV